MPPRPPRLSEERVRGCRIKLENYRLTGVTTQTCCLMTSAYVAKRNGNKSSTCWVFCGNKQRNVECFNTCQSKQRYFPNRLTTPGHTDTRKGRAVPKINSTHRAGCNYSVSNLVMKGPGLRLEVSSFKASRAELKAGHSCKRGAQFSHKTSVYLDTDLLNYGICIVVLSWPSARVPPSGCGPGATHSSIYARPHELT